MRKKALILKAAVLIDSEIFKSYEKTWGDSIQAKLLQEFQDGTLEIVEYRFEDHHLLT